MVTHLPMELFAIAIAINTLLVAVSLGIYLAIKALIPKELTVEERIARHHQMVAEMKLLLEAQKEMDKAKATIETTSKVDRLSLRLKRSGAMESEQRKASDYQCDCIYDEVK